MGGSQLDVRRVVDPEQARDGETSLLFDVRVHFHIFWDVTQCVARRELADAMNLDVHMIHQIRGRRLAVKAMGLDKPSGECVDETAGNSWGVEIFCFQNDLVASNG